MKLDQLVPTELVQLAKKVTIVGAGVGVCIGLFTWAQAKYIAAPIKASADTLVAAIRLQGQNNADALNAMRGEVYNRAEVDSFRDAATEDRKALHRQVDSIIQAARKKDLLTMPRVPR